MSRPLQADTEATLAALRSDLLSAAQRVAAQGRSRRRRRAMLILAVTALVPTVALATTDTNPLDWFRGHADSRIGFGFVVDSAHVPAGPTYPALTCTIGGRDCAPWPGVVCVAQTPAAPNCDTSRARRPGPSRQGYVFLEVAEPVRTVTRASTLALIASLSRRNPRDARALDAMASAVRRVSNAFWPAANRLFAVQTFTITVDYNGHPGRILVPPLGVPGFLRCVPGSRLRCAPLLPGAHVLAGTPLYEAWFQRDWVSAPRPAQDARLEFRLLETQLGHPITPDDVMAFDAAYAASGSQRHVTGSEDTGIAAVTTP